MQQAREKLGLTDGRPLIVSFWGSSGGQRHERATWRISSRLEAAEGMPFHHIHGVGKSGYPAHDRSVCGEDVTWRTWPSWTSGSTSTTWPPVMRAADLVICRAGASTISEITALAAPAILVPSPYVTNNHQEKNARILEQHGGAVVLLEADASGEALYRAALRYSP